MIVANSISEPGCGFAHDTNGVTLLTANSEMTLPVMSKDDVAVQIFAEILKHLP